MATSNGQTAHQTAIHHSNKTASSNNNLLSLFRIITHFLMTILDGGASLLVA